MAFVFFDGSRTTTSTSPVITIRKGGLIVLNAPAVAMLGDDVTHVQIGYDAEKNAIGIRSADSDAIGKYRLRKPPKGPSRLVNGKRLMAHHGLSTEEATAFKVEDFGDGLIGVTLTKKEEKPSEAKAPKAKKVAKKAA